MTLNIHGITTGPSAHLSCQKAVEGMLPDALAKAIKAYQALAGKSDIGDDLKAHQLHQAGCKAALQHIELLLKLANTADISTPNLQHNDLAALMAKAGDELTAYDAQSLVPEKTKGV